MLTLLSASLPLYLDYLRILRMMTSTASTLSMPTTNMLPSVASNQLCLASLPSCPAP